MPPLGLEVCGGHPDLPFTVRTRDGFPDFDGGNLLVFVDHVFEFRAEPALRHGGLRAGAAEAAHGPFEVIFVKGGEKPDQGAEQNTASAAVGVRWSEGVGIRLGAAGAGNAGRA